MDETTVTVTPQKKAVKPKKPTAPASHPKTIDMVIAAITNLKDRKGSSLQAVKKYIGANYKVDVEKITPFIRRGLKSAVIGGKLVQIKGTGASGSFKLNTQVKKSEKKPRQPKTPKKPTAKKVSTKKPKATTKKAAKDKKPKAEKPKAKTEKNAKKPKTVKKTATKKAKPAKKTPTKKPKAKTATKKKAAPKKK